MSEYQEAYNQIIGSLNLYRYELFFEKRNEPDSFIKEKKLLQELVDKATPKKPDKYVLLERDHLGFPTHGYCKKCGTSLLVKNNYCHNCGQAIDWSDEDE